MGSKSLRDGDSPSASSFLVPQLRQSRRGSLASISATSQLDKETLSQALDLIHSTASQTETLTTFNEYTTPPSSSSGPDSKGIASDLHGGLSGLYSRFRASVGNVKEIVNVGGEVSVADTTPSTNAKGDMKSPAPSTKKASHTARVTSSSASILQDSPTPRSGRQSPLGTSSLEAKRGDSSRQPMPSNVSLEGTIFESAPGKLPLKSTPMTLTQAAQPSSIRPALVEVNISAVKQGSHGTEPSPNSIAVSPSGVQRSDSSATTSRSHNGPDANNDVGIASAVDSDTGLPHISTRSMSDHPAGAPASDRTKVSSVNLYQPPIDSSKPTRSSPRSEDSVQPFPGFQVDDDEMTYAGTEASSDDDEGGIARPRRVITTYGNGRDNVFTGSDENGGSEIPHSLTRKGGYQHLALPLRKSIAPPLVTRAHSPNPTLSRASSYESNTDSLANSVSRPLRTADGVDIPNPAQLKISTSRPTDPSLVHRDLRTMNVFSQVKNKVLNKEYWMKDENAKDCFYCGDPFTTFRRKHHCSKHISLCHALIQKTNADLRKRNMWPNIRCKVHIPDLRSAL